MDFKILVTNYIFLSLHFLTFNPVQENSILPSNDVAYSHITHVSLHLLCKNGKFKIRFDSLVTYQHNALTFRDTGLFSPNIFKYLQNSPRPNKKSTFHTLRNLTRHPPCFQRILKISEPTLTEGEFI